MKTTTKAGKTKAPVMTTSGNVKTEHAPAVTPLKQNAAMTEKEEPKAEKKESPAAIAKKIEAEARQSDGFEFDTREEGQAVYDKLPAGQFSIKEGSKTVIQKL